MNIRTITIIDSFIHTESVEDKLIKSIEKFNNIGSDILLISNTPVNNKIFNKVKYFIYDSRNQLFEKEYINLNDVLDLWCILDDKGTIAHNIIVENIQKHGLSVLINLFNALKFAKNLGYTHFQRVEVDDIYEEKSLKWIKNVPNECTSNGKKGMFYTSELDISFHYFFCEIDYFISKVKNVSCEQDYIDYLDTFYGNKIFRNVETFIYDNLIKNLDDLLIVRNKQDMINNFPDTTWNTESSLSYFDKKYKGCLTQIYYVGNKSDLNYKLLTYSYIDGQIKRRIIVDLSNNEKLEFNHLIYGKFCWCISDLPKNIKSISVYENDILLYTETLSNSRSYITTS